MAVLAVVFIVISIHSVAFIGIFQILGNKDINSKHSK
jgi:hypothetical protein